jgi:ligand-binding sensor domain-containing protein
MLWPQKTRYLALAVVFGLGSMTAGGSADSRPREPSLAGVIETARLTVLERLQNGNEVRALVRDGDRVWVATSAGLAILKKGGLVAVGGSESLGLLNMLYLDQDNTLWVGGKRGAMRFRVHGGVDAGSQGLRLERLERVAGIDVRAMQRHRGQLYVGSWGRGPFVWKAGKLRSLLPPRRWRRSKRRLALLNVSALLEANGRLYVGTVGGGVAVLRARKNDKRLPRLRRLPSRGHAERMVWDLCRGAKGVWAASSAGLRHFVGRRERRRHALVVASKTLPVRDLRTVMCGGGPGPETLWVGSYGGGVYRLSGKTSSRMRFVSMRERVVALAKGKSELLVGTTAG